MATSNFIPEIWSARILQALDKELVYNSFFDTDYEGDIREAGDTVHIGTVGEVTIKKYTKDADIAAPDAATVDDQTLKIDQADYFNIAVDDVNAAQSATDLLDQAASRAGYGFSDVADQFLAKTICAASGTPAIGTKTAPQAITKENAYEVLVNLKTSLDKANCPKQGRVAVVPAEYEGFMLLDPRFVQVGTSESNTRLENGMVYRAAGFTVKTSNNCPTYEYGSGTKKAGYTVVASYDHAGTFANQVLKTEAYRPDSRFADAVKGLHVYGAKVTRPSVVACAEVAFN